VPFAARYDCRVAVSMSFLRELHRRNVTRVAIAYAAAAWVLLQVAGVVTPILGLPAWAPKLVFVLLATGFIPALVFAWAYEITPLGLKKEKEVDRAASITRVTGRKLDFVIIGVLVLAVTLLVVDRFSRPPATMPEQAPERSIAVLPFENMSADQEQEYFSDGITEEILNSLASVDDLKVAGRSSSFAFKDKHDDLRRIGKALGVAHILEGSVRKSGNRVRITAQLIKVEDGFHLWSDTYDRELTEVFAIQDEIANEILHQLQARLLGENETSPASRATDPAVYELYLLARQRIYNRNRASLESALDLLDQAIAKDPGYAPAYAQRGIATLLLSDRSYGTLPRDEAQRQGKRFVDRALELDPGLAEAWAGLGLYHYDTPAENEPAIEALTKALSINPNLLEAGNWLMLALEASGDYRNSIRLIENLTERDPLFPPAFGNGVLVFSQSGMISSAEALIEQYRAYDPDSPVLFQAEAMLRLFDGRSADGLRLAERAFRLAPSDETIRMAYSIGLAQTHQWQRLADEGVDFLKVTALDRLERDAEALTLASQLVNDDPFPLFALYNRAGRSRELTDYLEERWPTIGQLAAEHPHDPFGYALMAEVALAYSRHGNEERFEEALALVNAALQELAEAGIDNHVNRQERAKYHALTGDYEAAMRELEAAVARGARIGYPIAWQMPMFEPWQDKPRLLAAEATMVQNINAERSALGLAPIDGTMAAGPK
jgi:TolB-like protein/Tfp pilus assembly protein PilF